MAGKIAKTPTPAASDRDALSAEVFRQLFDAVMHTQVYHEGVDERAAAERRLEEVRAMIEHHTSDRRWRELLLHARHAARIGAVESLLLRFPSGQCTDGGRAINVGDNKWPETLTGASADVYRIWRDELQPKGFDVTARILEYPHGNLGDAGLFLSWKQHA